jgi:hypothetical protein
LHEILKISKVLLVLDGFDEIADISLREEIAEIITKGIRRIQNISMDLQVIITSRPAAFLNSPGFPKDEFEHYTLESVNSILVEMYSDKWIKAKQLNTKEGNEIKKILGEKLKQPHIRDLTRNPMQLAILISLIHSKGFSLPDKRTAFYDSYIDVFFNRESEKDETVRNYRELIIELHQYIAWIIHRDTEVGSNGRILQSDLVKLLEKYLDDEGHDNSIAAKLFNKMAERVVALVSRMQGTFEFEVQPLREYFCAKYLYSTAPYSPVGKEMHGTKPDRFDAMAKNFYWLNVVRFYCGCFDKGELPSIIDRLDELSNHGDYKFIGHPRELCSILLSDWVFAQYPKLMQQVVRILLDGLGMRLLLTSDLGYNFRSQELSLPQNSGRDEIIFECFKILKNYPPKDYSLELISLILSNDNGQISEIWKGEIKDKKGEELIKWLEYGMFLRVLHKLSDKELITFFEDKKNLLKKASILIQAGKSEFIESMNEVSETISVGILNGAVVSSFNFPRTGSFITSFWRILETHLYHTILNNSENSSCLQVLNRYSFPEDVYFDDLKFPKTVFLGNPQSNRYLNFYKIILKELEKPINHWNSSLEPWDIFIERGRRLFDEQLSFYNFACMGAGIKSTEIKSETFQELFDSKNSLVNRVRYARLRSTNANWWENQFRKISSDSERYLYVLVLIVWGSTNIITKLLKEIESCVTDINDDLFVILCSNLKKICYINNQNSNYAYYFNENIPSNLNLKTLKILAVKLQSKNLLKFKNDFFTKYEGNDPYILDLIIELSIENIFVESSVKQNLKIIKECYSKGSLSEKNILDHFNYHQLDNVSLKISDAKIILGEPSFYPRILIKVAETSLKKHISKSVKSVKEISDQEKWFIK